MAKKKTVKKKTRSKYKHEHIRSSSKMAKGSIRSVVKKRGKKKIIVRVGCPKGRYNKKTKKCKVGTRAVSVLKPNPTKNYQVFAVRDKHYYFWNGKTFDDNRHKAKLFSKETAREIAQAIGRTHRVASGLGFGVVTRTYPL